MGPFSYEKINEREANLTQIREDSEKKSTEEKYGHRMTLIDDSVDFP